MLAVNRGLKRSIYHVLMLLAAGALVASPAMAQINTVDPNDVIDSDLGTPPPAATATPAADVAPTVQDGVPTEAPATLPETPTAPPATSTANTYQEDDLIGVAEGVFGKSAQGIAKFIEDILKKEGRPNAYIVGREGGGAFVVGLRYGSGTLNHKVEGKMPIYWTGPSIGPDVGANTGSTFVLVYNLYDTEDIYKRYPSGEGVAYVGGGFNASYLARGDVVLITIRVGAGLRLGTNIGYMHFSKKQRWLPF